LFCFRRSPRPDELIFFRQFRPLFPLGLTFGSNSTHTRLAGNDGNFPSFLFLSFLSFFLSWRLFPLLSPFVSPKDVCSFHYLSATKMAAHVSL
jgi:hypothetical protein